MDPVEVAHIQKTTTEEKDSYNKAEELFLKLKSHFNHLKEELSAQSINFKDISEIPSLLSLCLISDSSLFESRSQNIKEIKRKNLKAAEICLKVILIYLESSHTVEAKRSIIHISLQSLYNAYIHCRDSETFYGQYFEEFTDELGNFYKLIQEIQKAALKCLDDLISTDSYDTDLKSTEIALITCDVGKLCELVSSLDRMISVVFWKMFIKLIFKFKTIAQKKVEVDSYLSALVLDIKDIVYQCKCCIETKEQIEESEVKMCIIELSTLKKIVNVFMGYLKQDSIIQIRDLALQLYNLLILSCSPSVAESKDLNIIKILLRTAKPVITSFFYDNMFFTSAFRCSTEDVSADLQLPLVLLKLTALDYLKTCSGSKLLQIEALKELFETLKKNKPEDDLQLVSLKMQESLCRENVRENIESISLFHYCYTCLTEYCKHMRLNNGTENLDNWLSIYTSSSDIVSLLISDVWIYYIRLGNANDVFKNCEVLAKALERLDSTSRIDMLLMRMLNFLPMDYKIILYEEEKYLSQRLCRKNFVSRFGSPPMSIMPDKLKSNEEIKMIMTSLNETISDDIETLTQKVCDILEAGALSIDELIPSELLKLLLYANLLLKSSKNFSIQMGVLSLIRTLNGRILSRNDKELSALTSVIAELFCKLMNSRNYIIKIEALDVYFNLAQSTSHTEIIRKVVIKCPNLTSLIKSFAEKAPPKGILKEERRKILSQRQLVLNHRNSRTTLPSTSRKEKYSLSTLLSLK